MYTTKEDIKQKIAEFDAWLTINFNNPNYDNVVKDKKAYELKLLLLNGPPKRGVSKADEIRQKIAEYDAWLIAHPDDRTRPLVEANKREWQQKLQELPEYLDLEVTEPEIVGHARDHN